MRSNGKCKPKLRHHKSSVNAICNPRTPLFYEYEKDFFDLWLIKKTEGKKKLTRIAYSLRNFPNLWQENFRKTDFVPCHCYVPTLSILKKKFKNIDARIFFFLSSCIKVNKFRPSHRSSSP